MLKSGFFLHFIIGFQLIVQAQKLPDTSTDSLIKSSAQKIVIKNLEIPKVQIDEQLIQHTAYSLVYNEKYEQAKWIAYELTSSETIKLYERTNNFLVDPLIKTGSANDADYAGSGFDRGHLAPASDMGWSSLSMVESFYYSNMSPQSPSFNRGVWKRLEELIRFWAVENEAVYVVTGPVLTSNLGFIGANQVAVPTYYYKVILDYSEPNIKGIGFILPNVGSSETLSNFAVSIDSIEKFTGIDFFPLLPDDQEKFIESSCCISCWSWKNTSKITSNETKTSTAIQCSGNTKAGERCGNNTTNATGYCHLHISQSEESSGAQTDIKPRNSSSAQCFGTTKAGARCKRKTLSPNGKCYQHGAD